MVMYSIFMNKPFVLSVALGALTLATVEAKHHRIYVLTGQSNSLGCTTNKNKDKKGVN